MLFSLCKQGKKSNRIHTSLLSSTQHYKQYNASNNVRSSENVSDIWAEQKCPVEFKGNAQEQNKTAL